jgi:rSAM/selenodomain-associated transferase 1
MSQGKRGPALVVFARNPVQGRVKTRLAAAIGSAEAWRVYLRLLNRTLSTAAGLAGIEISVWLDQGPPNEHCQKMLQRYGLPWHPQSGNDLGERMRDAINRSLKDHSQIVLIGSDCPELDATYLARAFDALDRVDVVLGPANDGGYVLIGARRPIDSLFDDVPWGSDQVLARTLSRLGSANLSHHLLPALRDIDKPADLEYLDGLNLHA